MATENNVVPIDKRRPKAKPEGRLFVAMRAIYAHAESKAKEERLSAAEVAVLTYIAFKDGDGNGCFAAVQTICDNTGIRTHHSVIKATKSLETRGLIEVDRTPSRSNTMRLKLDALGYAEIHNVENHIPQCGKPHSTMRKTAHEHSHQRSPEPSPVGDDGSGVNHLGKLSLAVDAESRLMALRIDGRGREEPVARARVRIEVPNFEETHISMTDDPRTKAWKEWCAAEPIGRFDSLKDQEQRKLVAFASWVWTANRWRTKHPVKASVSWMSKRWLKEEADRAPDQFDWRKAHWIETAKVAFLDEAGSMDWCEAQYRQDSVVALHDDAAAVGLAWADAASANAFDCRRADMDAKQANAQRALAIHVIRNGIADKDEIATLWREGEWKLAPEDDVVLLDGKLVVRP